MRTDAQSPIPLGEQDDQGQQELPEPVIAPVPPAPPLSGFTAEALDAAAQQAGFQLDPDQLRARDALLSEQSRGAYLWGPVGRGKSWLMDSMFESLTTPHKRRTHFHQLFSDLHEEIFRSGNAIDQALEALIGDTEVLCFDEFHLHDVGDAMLAARLLEALMRRPTRLVMTSNYAPEELLSHPLHHQLFAPTRALLHTELTVLSLNAGADYRAGRSADPQRPSSGFSAGTWSIPFPQPLDFSASSASPQQADLSAHSSPGDPEVLTINGRPLPVLFAPPAHTPAQPLVITFASLCEGATAPKDYLALADRFPRWRVLAVPDLADLAPSVAQRFGNLVDVLADQDTQVDFVAKSMPSALLLAEVPPLDVERTLSRLSLLTSGGR